MIVRIVVIASALLVAASIGMAGQEGADEKAPATFKVKFDSSAGPFVVEVHRAWAPIGADHFYSLVKSGFYNDVRFFRVVPNFMVQFGMSGDPKIQSMRDFGSSAG